MATPSWPASPSPSRATPSATSSRSRPDPARSTVSGWAIDPDSTNPINVDVWVDGAFTAKLTADVPRPDVGAAYPTYGPNHGFSGTVPVPAGSHEVCAYALNTGPGTSNKSLGCKTVTVGGIPFGHLEAVLGDAGAVTVSGWAIDPDSADPINVDVWVDGAFTAKITADVARPDVAAAYPAYGPNHGFDDSIPLPAGTHEVLRLRPEHGQRHLQQVARLQDGREGHLTPSY